jgi:hypothetical protein
VESNQKQPSKIVAATQKRLAGKPNEAGLKKTSLSVCVAASAIFDLSSLETFDKCRYCRLIINQKQRGDKALS